MKAAQSIIKRPVLTEKSSRLRERGGAARAPKEGDVYSQKIVFEVTRASNKVEIKSAVETLFNVKVTAVHTQIVRGKEKRVGRFSGMRPSWKKEKRVGRFSGMRPSWKKAIVTLKPGDSVQFFEGV